ncbi:hypothetical protein A0U92_05120 [Acetobacter aceti]|uniref:Uncharacterized protein n=1 Tax=Acetobacter aceti TaxID=435 RepID=A0A1U9KEU9_ACEAC|nr:hypothetical protein A0U92_05120 [Acetobacter aceti]
MASSVRSRIIFCAASASFQRSGSSARLFSSASLPWATSQSKMPPQQRNRLLDLLVERFRLGGHATVTPSFGVNLNGAEYRQARRMSSLGKKTEGNGRIKLTFS